MQKFLSRNGLTAISLVAMVVLFLTINIFSSIAFRHARLDLTENQLFTLSQGTKNILRSIEEPITIRLFYSEEIATDYQQVRVFAERVRDLLSEFSSIAGGKLIVEVIDPEPYTEAEDEAVANGLLGAPTGGGDSIYFGLVGTNSIDGREVIQFLAPEREAFIEYDLASLVYRLNTEKQPILGIVSGLSLDTGPGGVMAAMQGNAEPYMIYEKLLENFEVDHLEEGFDRIATEIEVLLIAHPDALSDTSLYAIDQFVMRGGRVIALLDPYSDMAASAQGQFGQPTDSATDGSTQALGGLLDSWGVQIGGDHVVGDALNALRVGYGFGPNSRSVDYVLWLGMTLDNFDQDNLVTGDLNLVHFASVGSITALEGATTEFTPLIQTSDQSMLIEYQEAKFQTPPEELLMSFAADGDRYVLAARVTGPVVSAFPDGAPELTEDEAAIESDLPALPAHLATSQGNANIILVADSDLLDDRFWVQVQSFLGQRIAEETADNGALIINAVEMMMGSSDLISLRTRSSSRRPFVLVEDIRRDAEAAFLPASEELDRKLDEIVRRVDEIRGTNVPREAGSEELMVTPDQRIELQSLLAEAAETRKSKRDIQYNLRADIDRLGARLKFLNVIFLPFIVAAFAIGVAIFRSRQRQARRTGASA